jgi:3-oxoacyl-(acyl-carrier-protein) synthase
VVTCVGSTANELWDATFSGQTGIREGLGHVDLGSRESSRGRGVDFSLDAARSAMSQAGWSSIGPTDGLILGTTTGQIDVWHNVLVDFLKHPETRIANRGMLDDAFKRQSLGAMLDALAEELSGTLGQPAKMTLLSSACSAATQAIALGTMWIEQGIVKRVLVGGAEVLSPLTVEGFKSLQLLSNEACLPFDSRRRGINLSEGAGFLCLESNDADAEPLARVSGYGLATDSFHMTGPHPEGLGCYRAIQVAVQSAGLEPRDISWVHAHGTGSELNDLSEGMAFKKLFGSLLIPVSSTKHTHGHALGASGAIEAVLCVEALRRQMVLKTGGLETPDAKIPVTHTRTSGAACVNHILKSTLGFGGINAALVFSRPGEA